LVRYSAEMLKLLN